ncbi:DUF805 domain-containing protein [Salinisphaera sp. Q1T1-3]|uniref:DUF805 domain-containing protein n=1 Tax=Salinisphaera sp. Q1T1-3 TaxID=2321229 RepID=UPI000E72B736|nr:DUF805 domain-containing protein [Salinisphaera sp. Q1T1-3]RJS94861.1 DUF805 domain-containing protein [Salinisphaera sp. Q1T1-3]
MTTKGFVPGPGAVLRFRGRAGRRELAGVVAAVVVALGSGLVLDRLVTIGTGYPFTVVAVLAGAYLLPAVVVRRLHDRGRRGFWILGVLAGPAVYSAALVIIVWLAMRRHTGVGETTHQVLGPVGSVLICLCLLSSLGLGLWLVVELVRAGAPGSNRFGPSPNTARGLTRVDE